MLHSEAHEEGGIAFTNKELLDQQRGAILELMKTVRLSLWRLSPTCSLAPTAAGP